MTENENLSASLEDYLETICQLSRSTGTARVTDISGRLGVHKSTVSAALRALGRKGLINYTPYRAATLTVSGQRLADEVVRRHAAIKRFLTEVLLVPERQAGENACRIEHAMDADVLARLVRFVDFITDVAKEDMQWIQRLGRILEA